MVKVNPQYEIKKRIKTRKLGELLMDQGVISEEQLLHVLHVQENRQEARYFGELLMELGLAKDEDIAQAFIWQYKFPFLPLLNYHIDRNVFDILPNEIMNKYNVVPVDIIGNTLTVAMFNPLMSNIIEEIEMITRLQVQPLVATLTDIKKVIQQQGNKISCK